MLTRAKIAAKNPESKRENSVSKIQKTDISQFINSPIDHILFLQRTIGNRTVQRLFEKSVVRTPESGGEIKASIKNNRQKNIHEHEATEGVLRIEEPIVQLKPTWSVARSAMERSEIGYVSLKTSTPTSVVFRREPFPALLYTSGCMAIATTIAGVHQFALDRAGASPPQGSLGMGFTSPRVRITRPQISLISETTDRGTFWSVQETTADIDIESRFAEAGDHDQGIGETDGGICSPSRPGNVRLQVFFHVSDSVSRQAASGEEDHCNDFVYAFERTFARESIEINRLRGRRFGPVASEAAARRLVQISLSRTDAQWEREFLRLGEQTDRRDRNHWHTFVTGAATVDAGCTRVTIPVVAGLSFRAGVPPERVLR